MKPRVERDAPDATARLGSSAAALDHVLAMMRVQLEAIRAHGPGARLGTDPEELHKMRTAVRRLRAILRAVRPILDREWVEGLRSELKWLASVLGVVRDLDVLRHYLRTELASLERADRPAARRILGRLDAEWARTRQGLLVALDDSRYFKVLDRLEEAIQHPRVVAANLSLPEVAAGEFKKLRRAVQALPKKPTARELHAVRVKVKRARYAAELAQAVVGRPADRFVSKARKLQDILGEHQDAVVTEERLHTLVADDGHGRRERSVAERLMKRQRMRRQATRAAFLAQWPKLKRRGRKAWKRARSRE
jgi:CHAD domain-containing protein